MVTDGVEICTLGHLRKKHRYAQNWGELEYSLIPIFYKWGNNPERERDLLVQEHVAPKNLNLGHSPSNSELIQCAFYRQEFELHAQNGVFPSTSYNLWFSLHHSRHFIYILLMHTKLLRPWSLTSIGQVGNATGWGWPMGEAISICWAPRRIKLFTKRDSQGPAFLDLPSSTAFSFSFLSTAASTYSCLPPLIPAVLKSSSAQCSLSPCIIKIKFCLNILFSNSS